MKSALLHWEGRPAALDYLDQLKKLEVDLSEDFLVVSFCDYDPEGWVIPQEFISHLALDVTGEIKLVRAGMIREQITQSTIDVTASEYPIRNKRGKLNQAKMTKYANFEAETKGIYIPADDDPAELVPARIEIDILPTDYILRKIVETLSEHLEGFSYQIREFKKAIHGQYDGVCNSLWRETVEEATDNVFVEYEPYYDEIERARRQLEIENASRATEERQQIHDLQQQIDALRRIISAKTDDIRIKHQALQALENYLDDHRRTAQEYHIEALHSGIYLPEPDEIIEDIEANGGWRDWAEDLSIDILGTRDLAIAAHNRWKVYDSVPWSERNSIRDWLENEIEDYYSFDTSFELVIDETPEELINRTLEEADQ